MRSRPSRWSVVAASLGATAVAATVMTDAVAQEMNLKLAREIEPVQRRPLPSPAPARAAPESAPPRVVDLADEPWLEFPLSNARKSGFLTPTIGSTQVRGFEIASPYYFNLAPNYDATIIPRLMTRRGLQIGAAGRYLFDNAAGQAVGEILPDDRETSTARWGFSWKHNQQIAPWLVGYLMFELAGRGATDPDRRCSTWARNVLCAASPKFPLI